MMTNKIQLSTTDTIALFKRSDECVQNGRYIVKRDRQETNVFEKDWYRSQFFFIDSSGVSHRYKEPSQYGTKPINALTQEEKRKRLNDFLNDIYGENSRLLLDQSAAYTQSIPLLISRYLIGADKVFSIFQRSTDLIAGYEHSVVKKVSIQNDRVHLEMDNKINGVQGIDCEINAHFMVNDDGDFELVSPIELKGKHAHFVRALWVNDYINIHKYWPEDLINKNKFNLFFNDLESQRVQALADINSYLETPNGKKRIADETLQKSITLFFQALKKEISKDPQKISENQKLLLTEIIQKTTNSLQTRHYMDYPRYFELAEKLEGTNTFRLVVASLLIIGLVALCAALIAISISSFGVGTPLVLGSIVFALNIKIAIEAVIAVDITSALAIGLGFFAAASPATFDEVSRAAKKVGKNLLVVDEMETDEDEDDEPGLSSIQTTL